MIRYLVIGVPPVGNGVTGQFTSMMGGANLDIAQILPDVLQSVRNLGGIATPVARVSQSW
jgi:hypothetical protein